MSFFFRFQLKRNRPRKMSHVILMLYSQLADDDVNILKERISYILYEALGNFLQGGRSSHFYLLTKNKLEYIFLSNSEIV